MNRFMRLFLALFFTIALPVNGMAQMLMQAGPPAADPVSMSPHAMHAGMSEAAMQQVMAPCDEHDSNGLVRDSGEECKTSGLLQLHFGKSHALPPAQPPLLAEIGFLPLPLPEPLWHPPRS